MPQVEQNPNPNPSSIQVTTGFNQASSNNINNGVLSNPLLADVLNNVKLTPPLSATSNKISIIDNHIFSNPTNPTGTSSTTAYVMMGLGSVLNLIPVYSGNIRIYFNGGLSNSVVGDGTNLTLAYGTGTAPSNGTSATGTVFTPVYTRILGTANQQSDCSIIWELTNLTLNTNYWVDAQLEAITGGTSSVGNITCVIEEIA